MNILGFHFTQISAERSEVIKKLEKISTNIDFKNIEKDKIELIKESNILKVFFEFKIDYEPKQATIILKGLLPISVTKEEAEVVLKDWKKKGLKEEFKVPIFNFILDKCSVKALQMEEELNLPKHIKLPILKPKNN